MNEIPRSGEHTASSGSLVKDGNFLMVIENIVTAFRKQNIHHEFDNISACVMVTSFGIFGEFPDEFLKDIPFSILSFSSNSNLRLEALILE